MPLLILVCLAVGFAGGAYFYYHRVTQSRPVEADTELAVTVSAGTKAVLQALDSPVEIRFYALLGEQGVAESLRAFAARADRLLAGFEAAANGRIIAKRYISSPEAGIQAATADGLRPFNLDRGDTCYLGFTVAQDNEKETLPQLVQEWETALEADLTRAIVRVNAARQRVVQATAAAAAEAVAVEAVKQALPNHDSLSAEEGTQKLRETALKDFKEMVGSLQTQIEQAEERVRQALNIGSEAEQQAPLQRLRQLQAEQTAKLQEIASQLQTQIAAFERLKGVAPASKSSRTNLPTRGPPR